MPLKDSPEDDSNISEGPKLADTMISSQNSCHEDCCANEGLGAQEIEIIVGECIPDGAGGCQRSQGRETSCCTSNSDRVIAGMDPIQHRARVEKGGLLSYFVSHRTLLH